MSWLALLAPPPGPPEAGPTELGTLPGRFAVPWTYGPGEVRQLGELLVRCHHELDRLLPLPPEAVLGLAAARERGGRVGPFDRTLIAVVGRPEAWAPVTDEARGAPPAFGADGMEAPSGRLVRALDTLDARWALIQWPTPRGSLAWLERDLKPVAVALARSAAADPRHPLSGLGLAGLPIREAAKRTSDGLELLALLGATIAHRATHAAHGAAPADWERSLHVAVARRLVARLALLPPAAQGPALTRLLAEAAGDVGGLDPREASAQEAWLAHIGLARRVAGDVALGPLARSLEDPTTRYALVTDGQLGDAAYTSDVRGYLRRLDAPAGGLGDDEAAPPRPDEAAIAPRPEAPAPPTPGPPITGPTAPGRRPGGGAAGGPGPEAAVRAIRRVLGALRAAFQVSALGAPLSAELADKVVTARRALTAAKRKGGPLAGAEGDAHALGLTLLSARGDDAVAVQAVAFDQLRARVDASPAAERSGPSRGRAADLAIVHATSLMSLARTPERLARAAETVAWAKRLLAEDRRGLDPAGRALEADIALQQGRPGEARDLAEALLAQLPKADAHGRARLTALTVAAAAEEREGRLDEAQARLDAALALAERLEDPAARVPLFHLESRLAGRRGDPDSAYRALERALRVDESCGHAAGRADTYRALGLAAQRLRDVRRAALWYQRALTRSLERGEVRDAAGDALLVAALAEQRGALDEAAVAYERAADLGAELSDPYLTELAGKRLAKLRAGRDQSPSAP